jgi:shikimate dehydrogenase
MDSMGVDTYRWRMANRLQGSLRTNGAAHPGAGRDDRRRSTGSGPESTLSHRYAVIGDPIADTKLPLINRAFARAAAREIEYRAIDGPPSGFRETAERFRADGGRGLNVNAPFLGEALALATHPAARARLARAANALKFDSGRILAEDFRGTGLTADIERNLGLELRDRRVLLLGAGGAALSSVLSLLDRKPGELVIVNRSEERAQTLAREFAGGGPVIGCAYSDLGDAPFDVVIDTTGAGLKGELPPISPRVFADDALAYDFVYAKGLTPFLRLARNAGVKHLADGVGMLVEQAAEAFQWWHGVRPQTRTLIDKLTIPLA